MLLCESDKRFRVGDTDPIRNLYREAVGMLLGAFVTALWGLLRPENHSIWQSNIVLKHLEI